MFFRARRTNENEGTFTAALQLFWTTYFAGQVLQGIRMSNHSSTCSAVSLWNSKTLPDLERSQRRPGLVTCIQCFIKAVRYLFWWSDGFPASVIEWWRLAVVVSGLHNGFSVAHLRLFLLGCFATFFPHDRFSISLLRNIFFYFLNESWWAVCLHKAHPDCVTACPAHLGRSVDVARVVADLQGPEHRCQDGGQQRGGQTALERCSQGGLFPFFNRKGFSCHIKKRCNYGFVVCCRSAETTVFLHTGKMYRMLISTSVC